MSRQWVLRVARSPLVRSMFDAPAARWLLRTSSARKVADVMRRAASRIDAANAQSPVPAIGSSSSPAMPEWVAKEVYAAAHIEPELVPDGGDLSRYAFYAVPSDARPGEAYDSILAELDRFEYSHVFLVPWLKQGGADRGVIHHVNALSKLDPAAAILVVSTEPTESPWADRLPPCVKFLNFGRLLADVDFNKQVLVLARLLIQISPRAIHLINSRVGWETVRAYGLALRQASTLYASLFCDDFDSRMRPVGYARTYLRDTYHHFRTIYCDNSHYPRLWSKELGVPLGSFTVLPFPYDGDIASVPDRAITSQGAARVIWAGRFDRQKRLDVLAQVAQSMPDVAFDVYGTAVVSAVPDPSLILLQGMRNVVLHGEFRQFRDVASTEHFAYLHTTSWEGTPTILFDAAAVGLPVCAPRVGGIPDFLGSEDLIEDPDAIEAYVQRLRELRDSSEQRDYVVSRQRRALTEQRSWPDFVRRVRESQQALDQSRELGR
jgi:glycosyltransferase involved in cell wall biosynthesis